MPKGPRGEKRPTSSVSSMMKAMRVATGIEPEEYVEQGKEENESSDEDESEEYEMAALETTDSIQHAPLKGSKKRAKKRRKKLTK